MDIRLPQEVRAGIILKIKSYFLDERDEEIGDLAAGFLLDFVQKEITPFYYNQGLNDAKEQILKSFSLLNEELDCLEKLPPKRQS